MNLNDIIKSRISDYPEFCNAIVDMELSCSYPMELEESVDDVSGMRVRDINPEYTIIAWLNRRITLQSDSIIEAKFMSVLRDAVYNVFTGSVFTKWIKNIEIRERHPLITNTDEVTEISDIDQLFD